MASPKYDGVVEAVHYKPSGEIDWIRAYIRRGPTFSDYVILNRQHVIEALKAGKKFMVGKRIINMASTFDVSKNVQLLKKDGQEFVVTGDSQAAKDYLEGVPRL